MNKLRSQIIHALLFAIVISLTPVGLAQSVAKRTSSNSGPLASSPGLSRATPEAVGMSADRLARIRPVIEQYVKDGRIAGTVTLVMRNGKVAHLEAIGNQSDGKPMREDAIFRIASMTKAVTSVAAMILHEEGRLPLSDPLSKYIPEFKGVQVLVPS